MSASWLSMLGIRFLLSFFYALMFCAFGAVHANALDVDAVRIGEHDGQWRIVLDLDSAPDFNAFVLETPNRLVVDLPTFVWKAPSSIVQSKNTIITTVRHGNLDADTSRIVFDLKNKVNIIKSFSLQASLEKSNRVVIDVAVADSDLSVPVQAESSMRQPVMPPKPAPPAPPVQSIARKKIIVVDPGHGGKDPGASNGRTYEKHIVLGIGHQLKKALEATGRYKVYMTRSDDRFIKLYDRVKFARRHKADLFISVHADSIKKRSVRGASIYTLSERASDAQTAKLAARENKADLIDGIDLTHEDKDVAGILLDLVQRDTMNQSNYFAETVVGKFKNSGIRILDNPHRSAGFAVLKAPDIPSILIEAGFVSNSSDARLLTQRSYQKKVALSIAGAVDGYLKKN